MVWKLINAWISRHPGEQVILIGDMNGSIPGVVRGTTQLCSSYGDGKEPSGG